MRVCPPAPVEGIPAGAVGQARHSITTRQSQFLAASDVEKFPDLCSQPTAHVPAALIELRSCMESGVTV